MGPGNCPIGIQRCVYHSPLQTKRQQTGVRQSQRHLSPLHSWKKILARIPLIGSSIILSRAYFQRASVDSGKSEVPPTWYLLHASCRKNARNKMSTFTQHLSISPNHSTPSVATVSGRSWASSDAQTNSSKGPTASRWNASASSWRQRIFHSLPCHKRSETRLCSCPNTV